MLKFHDIAKGSDMLVKFLHVATGTKVQFPAFITDFSDNYSVSWGNESVFGRMDPVKPYNGTTRRIQMSFDILSPTLEMAQENMNKYSTLVKMLYPVYNPPLSGGEHGLGRTLKAPPLLRLQFMNLVKNQSPESMEMGLLGCINGFQFRPNKESGFFTYQNELLSKNFNISFSFEPQHESPLGFREDKFINPVFPYGRSDENSPSSDKTDSDVMEVSTRRTRQVLGD